MTWRTGSRDRPGEGTPPASSAGPIAAADDTTGRGSCRARVPEIDVSSWEEVAAEGFTFCVPPDAERVGSVWRSAAARLQWGRGAPPGAVDRTVFVRPDPRSRPDGEYDATARSFSEEIGGRRATIFQSRQARVHSAEARWRSPLVWIRAESDDPGAAAVRLAVFRTVRFSGR